MTLMKPDREKFSRDKYRAAVELVFGTRALDFQALLKKVPSVDEFHALSEQLKIHHQLGNVIFDLDGTLVPPYGSLNESLLEYLESYKSAGKQVVIFTNSPHSKRVDFLRNWGFLCLKLTWGSQACQLLGRFARSII